MTALGVVIASLSLSSLVGIKYEDLDKWWASWKTHPVILGTGLTLALALIYTILTNLSIRLQNSKWNWLNRESA